VLSLSERSPIPSQVSSAASTHLSFDHSPTASMHNTAPLVSVSPSPPAQQPLPAVPAKSSPTTIAQPAPVASVSSGSQPAKADKEFAVGKEGSDEEEDDDDDEESEEESEEEQDYSEYNDADPNSGGKELSDFKRPTAGGSSSGR
jgi:hypothetical protein